MGSERLFLVEVLVDNVYLFDKAIDIATSPLTVRIEFLDCPYIEIKQDEFIQCTGKPEDGAFSNGKSCLFPMDIPEFTEQLSHRPLKVAVLCQLADMSSLHFLGDAIVSLRDIAESYLHKKDELPIINTISSTYPLLDLSKKPIGSISLFIRCSCFGRTIVTKFQVLDESKTYLFRNSKDESEFQKTSDESKILSHLPHYEEPPVLYGMSQLSSLPKLEKEPVEKTKYVRPCAATPIFYSLSEELPKLQVMEQEDDSAFWTSSGVKKNTAPPSEPPKFKPVSRGVTKPGPLFCEVQDLPTLQVESKAVTQTTVVSQQRLAQMTPSSHDVKNLQSTSMMYGSKTDEKPRDMYDDDVDHVRRGILQKEDISRKHSVHPLVYDIATLLGLTTPNVKPTIRRERSHHEVYYPPLCKCPASSSMIQKISGDSLLDEPEIPILWGERRKRESEDNFISMINNRRSKIKTQCLCDEKNSERSTPKREYDRRISTNCLCEDDIKAESKPELLYTNNDKNYHDVRTTKPFVSTDKDLQLDDIDHFGPFDVPRSTIMWRSDNISCTCPHSAQPDKTRDQIVSVDTKEALCTDTKPRVVCIRPNQIERQRRASEAGVTRPMHPPIRYDTTGILSPAYRGETPKDGIVYPVPLVRYDNTGKLSAAYQNPPVRYDTTGKLSPAFQGKPVISKLKAKEVSSAPEMRVYEKTISLERECISDKDLISKKKKKKRKKCQFVHEWGVKYPGVIFGHGDCIEPSIKVPGNRGWLWDIDIWSCGYRRPKGWKPGAVSKPVSRLMGKMYLARDAAKPEVYTGDRMYSRGVNTELTGNVAPVKIELTDIQYAQRPTLHLQRHAGNFYITMRSASPDFEDKPPARLKIPSPDGRACAEDEHGYPISSASSDLEMEVISPAAQVPRPPPPPRKICAEVQYNEKDCRPPTPPLLPSEPSAEIKKTKPKAKKPKGKAKSKKRAKK